MNTLQKNAFIELNPFPNITQVGNGSICLVRFCVYMWVGVSARKCV